MLPVELTSSPCVVSKFELTANVVGPMSICFLKMWTIKLPLLWTPFMVVSWTDIQSVTAIYNLQDFWRLNRLMCCLNIPTDSRQMSTDRVHDLTNWQRWCSQLVLVTVSWLTVDLDSWTDIQSVTASYNWQDFWRLNRLMRCLKKSNWQLLVQLT